MVGSREVWRSRLGLARNDGVGSGSAVMAWRGKVGLAAERRGWSWRSRCGREWSGLER